MDTYKRIAYLHQVQSLLNDIGESKRRTKLNKPREGATTSVTVQTNGELQLVHSDASHSSSAPDKPFIKLNSFFGHLSKEISMKHNIHILNCDQMRQFRCKRCFCQFDFHRMSLSNRLIQLERSKSTKVNLKLTCPQCSYVRKVIFHKRIKAKYEQVLAKETAKPKQWKS